MERLNFSGQNTTISIDSNGFSHNGTLIRWSEIQSCDEHLVSVVDLGDKRFLNLQLASGAIKIDNWPDDAYMALRVVLKELMPQKVNLDGPRYLKFGPGECEFVISIARFLRSIDRIEESKFAYNKAIELIEYYHNLKHELLLEPLTALSEMLRQSEPAKASALSERAQSIGKTPVADRSFFGGIANARSKKEKIQDAIDEFRRTKKRDPKPTEKARILKEIENE
jgi:tetratricopeptide (TPR) repeat protein